MAVPAVVSKPPPNLPPGAVEVTARARSAAWQYEIEDVRLGVEEVCRQTAARTAKKAGLVWLDAPVMLWIQGAVWWECHVFGYGIPASD